jgi:hypothetical protein
MNEVGRFLDAFQYENALTLAEIMYAEDSSEGNLVILAEVCKSVICLSPRITSLLIFVIRCT